MKHFLIGLLIIFVCVGCVQAVQEYGCSMDPATKNPLTGDLYIISGLPHSADMVFYVDLYQATPAYGSLPSPMDAKKGYILTPSSGTHLLRVERPGYLPFVASVTVCPARITYVPLTLLPTAATTTPSGSGFGIHPGVTGITLPPTTTSASSGNLAGQLKGPTIAAAGTTAAAIQGSGSQTGGSGSQNTGTGTTGSGQTGTTQPDSSQAVTAQAVSQQSGAAAGNTDTANTGSLSVTTTPAGAFIFIDGVQRGVTPASIPGIPAGSHTILLKLDGYLDLSTPIIIAAGKTQDFSTSLAKNTAAPTSTIETFNVATTVQKSASPGFGTVFGIAIIGTVLCMRKRRAE